MNKSRVENRKALVEILSDRIATFQAAELNRRLQERNVPAAIVQNLEESFQAPEAKSLILESEEGTKGIKTYVGDTGSARNATHILPPPHFGENTGEILAKTLQYGPETIEMLRLSGVIN